MSTPSAPAESPSAPKPTISQTVVPHLVCAGAAGAMDFYAKAFGAEETCRLVTPDGRVMHGALRIGDSMIFLHDEYPEHGALGPKARGGSSVTIHVQVPDVDASFERAVQAGVTVKMPPADMFWGDRYCNVEDAWGHSWSFASHVRDVGMEELQRFASQSCG